MASATDDVTDRAAFGQKVDHLDRFARASAARKQQVYARLQVRAGQHVLDVGCGVGADTLPLGRLVGPTGHVSGIDADRDAVAEANRRATAAGVGAWVAHRVGDAYALPFPDDAFDACHSERVFLHLARPEQAVGELVRVTKPGGRVAIIDGDGASFSIDTPEADVERRIVPFWAAKHRNGFAGRQLYRQCKHQGLVDVEAELSPGPILEYPLFARLFGLDDIQARALRAGAVTVEEAARFRTSLEAAAADGTFFAIGGVVTVVGRKP